MRLRWWMLVTVMFGESVYAVYCEYLRGSVTLGGL